MDKDRMLVTMYGVVIRYVTNDITFLSSVIIIKASIHAC